MPCWRYLIQESIQVQARNWPIASNYCVSEYY
jgi:hypothetical protein